MGYLYTPLNANSINNRKGSRISHEYIGNQEGSYIELEYYTSKKADTNMT